MKLNKILAILAVCFVAVGCYEDFESVPERVTYDDSSFEARFPSAQHITIAELKKMFIDEHGSLSGTGENNDSWSTMVNVGNDGNVSDVLHTIPIYLSAKVRFFNEKLFSYLVIFSLLLLC